ncbi:hypothetical protein HDA32_003593 [Spinactinospora alkalitolerans]|uniref:Uncharacterized protein n=1 Tax=Spinactinospora alkalitolerans TaxID=687207 RepID=A0A852U0E2_9ACTN|nr:hypothetical protein [Spinactinospora alkalitolerans]
MPIDTASSRSRPRRVYARCPLGRTIAAAVPHLGGGSRSGAVAVRNATGVAAGAAEGASR